MMRIACCCFFLSLVLAGPAGADQPVAKRAERAKISVSQLAAGQFEAAARPFDKTMKQLLPAGKLKQVWDGLIGQYGPLQRATETRTERIRQYDVVYVTCRFQKGTLDAKVVFTSENEITGLFFVPAGEYRRPAYADASAFADDELNVGQWPWSLPGTLSLPKGAGPFPAVVLVHGSGPNDRDETIGPNKPFRDLAHGLATRGIAVLRYEKRTREHPLAMSLFSDITTKAETIDDAVAAVRALAAHKAIDGKRIFVLGHSLGGTLLPRIAAAEARIAGLIGLAGSTKPLEDSILAQVKYLASLDGKITDEERKSIEQIERQVAKVKSGALTRQTDNTELPLHVPASYWLDLRGYDPAKSAKKIRKPMLFLQGERDYQVTLDDFTGWKNALAERNDVKFISYPNLNHLFMEGKGKSSPAEYSAPGNVAGVLVSDVADWIKHPPANLPRNLQAVLVNTKPLAHPRGGRLPLYVLPISGLLRGLDDRTAEQVLRQLDDRGIAYTVNWSPSDREKSLAEGLRIASIQKRLGLAVNVDATACLSAFFNGDERTAHVDDGGKPFFDGSFALGAKMGCPFAVDFRIPEITAQVAFFLRGYADKKLPIDFIFADWEIDGPIEWNGAWAASKRCRRCREQIPHIDDFRAFQRELRIIRSRLQRDAFAANVLHHFPKARVGNYGVYPDDGYRYWYDYYETPVAGAPVKADQKARYREWFPEFALTGYTCAMPVVYTWYPIFGWYDFPDPDYRWFYNMLLVASTIAPHTKPGVPIISFVHWTTTAPPGRPDPQVKQMSAANYQELLRHMLLRGHHAFFLWCQDKELAEEIRLVHEVYAEALEFREFLDRGEPVSFEVPRQPGPVISGLRLGNLVLFRRTDLAPVPRSDGHWEI